MVYGISQIISSVKTTYLQNEYFVFFCQRNNIESTHTNQSPNGSQPLPVFQRKRSFSLNCQIVKQKHLLEPSIAERETQSPSNSTKSVQSLYDVNSPFLATLKVNRELIQSGARSCRHIEFDISGSNMKYEPGDHIGIYPTNESELVEKLGQICDADLDANIPQDGPIIRPQTFLSALTNHIEISAVPQIPVLKALAKYCTEESDRCFLDLISSSTREGKDLYESWVLQAQRNIVHVLEDLKSCRPPIDAICQMLPKLQPRYYSISSSSRLHPNVVHVTVVLVKYETKTGRLNKGVATAFLANKHPSSGATRVPVFIRKSEFHLPKTVQTPIIMIGTGTGLAPFLGFIQERDHWREKNTSIGETILYFGARKRSEDFIYEKVEIFLNKSRGCFQSFASLEFAQELNEYVEKGTLELRAAFSRDQPEKIYVTQLMREDADSIWKVIESMGHIYVCG